MVGLYQPQLHLVPRYVIYFWNLGLAPFFNQDMAILFTYFAHFLPSLYITFQLSCQQIHLNHKHVEVEAEMATTITTSMESIIRPQHNRFHSAAATINHYSIRHSSLC
jgi:hypothetical protein